MERLQQVGRAEGSQDWSVLQGKLPPDKGVQQTHRHQQSKATATHHARVLSAAAPPAAAPSPSAPAHV